MDFTNYGYAPVDDKITYTTWNAHWTEYKGAAAFTNYGYEGPKDQINYPHYSAVQE